MAWTYESIGSEAMVLTNTMDSEDVQLDNIRNHVNSSLSYLSNLLNLAERPWYGIWLNCLLDNAHISGLDTINLATPEPTTGFVAANGMHSIKRVSTAWSGAATALTVNFTKWDLSQMTHQLGQLNTQNRFTVAWTWHGSDLLVYAGSLVASQANTPVTPSYSIISTPIIIWGYRKPILDNMVAPSVTQQTANAGNYRSNIDLPDEYAELLVKLVMQKIYTQKRERVPESLTQEVNEGVAQISQLIQAEVGFEAQEREKRAYGTPTRAPGGM